MTTEKFLCKKCPTICFISICFNEGDEKTKSSLVCPLQMINYDFEIVDKSPERAVIKVKSPSSTKRILEGLEITKKVITQFTFLRKMMKDCSLCIHTTDDDYCFKNCRGFSEYHESAPDDTIIRDRAKYDRPNA